MRPSELVQSAPWEIGLDYLTARAGMDAAREQSEVMSAKKIPIFPAVLIE